MLNTGTVFYFTSVFLCSQEYRAELSLCLCFCKPKGFGLKEVDVLSLGGTCSLLGGFQ